MTGFRTGEFVNEHIRNLRSRPLRTTMVVLVAAILGAAVMLIALLNVGHIRQQWDEQVQAGRFIEVVRSKSVEGFPSSYCEDVARIDGVVAAGGITGRRTVDFAELPGLDREVVTVTPGLIRVAWPGAAAPESGYVAGTGLAAELGLVPGALTTLRASDEQLAIETVPTGPPRVDGVSGALIEIHPAGQSRMRECLVAYEPGAQDEVRSLLDVATPELYPSLHEPLLQRNDLVQDPEQLLRNRPSAWSPAIAAGLLTVVFALLWWGSRQELAIYRSLGARPGHIMLAYAAEVSITALVPIAVGALCALAFWQGTSSPGEGGVVVPVSIPMFQLAGVDLCLTEVALIMLPPLGAVLARTLSPVAVFKGA